MATLEYKGKRHLPLPKGPFTVGCTDVMTGNSVNGTFVRLFYPCNASGTLEHYEQWPLWAPSKNYLDGCAVTSLFPSFIVSKLLEKYCGDVHIPAIIDAEPVMPGRLLPLVIFSHGMYGFRTVNSNTHVELASHGYVVAGIEHRDRSAAYTYYIKSNPSTSEVISQSESSIGKDRQEDQKSGSYDYFQELRTGRTGNTEEVHLPITESSLSRKHAMLRNKQVHQRAEECSRALDLLRDINEGIAPRNQLETNFDLKKFQGLFDMNKVALAGYSFGGATVLMGLATDPRFRVGLTLDPWTVPLEMDKRIPLRLTQPILFIKSSNDFYDGKALKTLKEFDSSEVERKFVTIRGTTHLSQCDVVFMIPNAFTIFTWGRVKGDMNIHADIHNRMMLTFLSEHLDLPINADHEHYITSMSSLIDSGFEVPGMPRGYMFTAFLIPCILFGLFASLLYWFKKEVIL